MNWHHLCVRTDGHAPWDKPGHGGFLVRGSPLALRPVLPDRVASVPADRRLAHRVEDAHPGRRRLGHFDDRAGMAFVQEVDERSARRVALLADLPAARQRTLADPIVVLRPARPLLHARMPGAEKVAVAARA